MLETIAAVIIVMGVTTAIISLIIAAAIMDD